MHTAAAIERLNRSPGTRNPERDVGSVCFPEQANDPSSEPNHKFFGAVGWCVGASLFETENSKQCAPQHAGARVPRT